MTTVQDIEHQSLARVIEGAAALVHEPDDCEMCAGLDLRRHLNGLADQIQDAVRNVNGTPHVHGPAGKPKPKPKPKPSPKPKPKPGTGR